MILEGKAGGADVLVVSLPIVGGDYATRIRRAAGLGFERHQLHCFGLFNLCPKRIGTLGVLFRIALRRSSLPPSESILSAPTSESLALYSCVFSVMRVMSAVPYSSSGRAGQPILVRRAY